MNRQSAALVLSVSLFAGAVALVPVGQVLAQPEGKKAEAEPTLKVGSKAPAISVDKWVKIPKGGSEVASFESGKVYVVEFWATWCPPCREAIPDLTEMVKSNPGLTILSIAASERPSKEGPDDRLAKLEKFVSGQGDKMNYHVAYDGDRDMGGAWMKASGKRSIPTAFVVDGEGKIAWIGNPHEDEFKVEVQKALKAAKKG